MRTISMPPGLGDSAWVLQKLINANEKFTFKIPDAYPQRGKQLFDLLPQISGSCFYDSGLKFNGHVKPRNHAIESTDDYRVATFKRQPFPRFKELPRREWKNILTNEIYLEANTFLENGLMLKEFLPDLPISYTLPFVTTDLQKRQATEISGGKYIGIYCATYSGSRNWGTWMVPEWLQLIELLASQDRTFVIIGASYDDLTSDLYWQVKNKEIPVISMVGADLGITLEVLKRLDCFIGFPSGLSILNELCGAKRTFMFYSEAIKAIINTWGDPKRIESGELREDVFCAPEQAFEWIKNNWTI